MFEQIGSGVSLVLSIIALGGIIWGWFTAGGTKALKALGEFMDEHRTKHEEIDRSLSALDRRVQTVEDELKHLPDKDSVVELKLAITKLEGGVGTLTESLSSISRTVHRIDDWLRQKEK